VMCDGADPYSAKATGRRSGKAVNLKIAKPFPFHKKCSLLVYGSLIY
jgi:hypothetical protein